jgi:hypothetical protein
LRSITTTFTDSRIDAICLDLAMHSPSLTLSLFLLFEMTISTLLLCTEQWAAWSCHLQLLQHSLKCFDIWWHFKRVSYCVSDCQYNWQKSTHSDFKSESHWCTMTDEFLSELMWYNSVQTKCCHQTEQEWPLFERSEHTNQAAVNQLRKQN